ncbi:hypothetical protein B0H66DRAFT_299085 [Apodospora peruviana]|uniref:Uncharacterized protein n=1 Tax=Apodospora peruviana TaxID=516989 RepID=A0AAE0I100_9PEZI|nr:hypothetical protein B0H66DRAFT_299085 [Apodospora peruviana]
MTWTCCKCSHPNGYSVHCQGPGCLTSSTLSTILTDWLPGHRVCGACTINTSLAVEPQQADTAAAISSTMEQTIPVDLAVEPTLPAALRRTIAQRVPPTHRSQLSHGASGSRNDLPAQDEHGRAIFRPPTGPPPVQPRVIAPPPLPLTPTPAAGTTATRPSIGSGNPDHVSLPSGGPATTADLANGQHIMTAAPPPPLLVPPRQQPPRFNSRYSPYSRPSSNGSRGALHRSPPTPAAYLVTLRGEGQRHILPRPPQAHVNGECDVSAESVNIAASTTGVDQGYFSGRYQGPQ